MKRKIPPLNALRAFEAAARHNSFRKAAIELSVTHSAISHQIKFLEQYLSIDLFYRRARSVELTKVGKEYYPILRDAFDRLAQGTELILSPQSANVITVQVYSTFAVRWLIPKLPDFKATHPDMEIRLSTSVNDVDFNHDDVDICVMQGEPNHPAVQYQYLFSSYIYPVCSAKYLQQNPGLLTVQDLSKHTVLQVNSAAKDWSYWLNSNFGSQINPNNGIQFENYDHALNAAEQGMGVALGIEPFVDEAMEQGRLVTPFTSKLRHPHDWFVASLKEKSELEKIKDFRNWLLGQIATDRAAA